MHIATKIRAGVPLLLLALAACGQPDTTMSNMTSEAATALVQRTATPPVIAQASASPTIAPTVQPTIAPTATMQPTIAPTAPPSAAPSMSAMADASADSGMTMGESAQPTGETVQATIKLFMFKPEPLTIKAGTEVVWTNNDNIGHSVTSGTAPTTDGAFDSGLFEQNQTFAYTFTTPGTYAYFCTRHNSMTGTIIVQP